LITNPRHPKRDNIVVPPCRYFLSSKAKVESELASYIQAQQDEAQKLTSQRARAERGLLETENEIRELLKHSPELANKLATLAG
jgi:hypothetical protein